MNSFDIAVSLGLTIAVVTGFKPGLLRGAITILAYLFAMPVAVWAMSMVTPQIEGKLAVPLSQSWFLFFGIFLIAGMGLGKLARMALDEAIGSDAGIGDRLRGGARGGAPARPVVTTP